MRKIFLLMIGGMLVLTACGRQEAEVSANASEYASSIEEITSESVIEENTSSEVHIEVGTVTESDAEMQVDVLDTPVSPELLPPKEGEIAQKTEDLVGPYELHDFFMYYILRFGYMPHKVYRLACHAFEGEYERDVIYKWLRTFYWRFFGQQFKRSCLPDGPKVGSVGVSPRGDLRMPSDAARELWIKDLENI